jgi:hypothetical protein
MRNRHEGGGTPQWWDDLPPQVRNRFKQPVAQQEEQAAPPDSPLFSRLNLLVDLSKLAAVLFLVSVGILLYLLVAMSYVSR